MRPRDPLHLLHNIIICMHLPIYSFTFCNGIIVLLFIMHIFILLGDDKHKRINIVSKKIHYIISKP